MCQFENELNYLIKQNAFCWIIVVDTAIHTHTHVHILL